MSVSKVKSSALKTLLLILIMEELLRKNLNQLIRRLRCLETQEFPDFLNYSHFTRFILKKNEKHTTTTYKFCE